jgi:hypothetical protein
MNIRVEVHVLAHFWIIGDLKYNLIIRIFFKNSTEYFDLHKEAYTHIYGKSSREKE